MKRLPLLLIPCVTLALFSAMPPGGTDCSVEVLEAKSPAQDDFKTTIAPLLAKYCTSCHGGDSPKNDLSLEFGDDQGVEQRLLKDRKVFERVAERIRLGEMPPQRQAKPSEAEKNVLVTWIDRDVLRINCAAPYNPGQVARVRRLTRVEYANTVRDLFYFREFKPADDFPADDIGYGFDNIADLLSVSPNLLEQYMKTAEQAIAQLDKTAKLSPNWAGKDKSYWEPDDGVFLPIRHVKLEFNNNQDRVRLVLQKFLPRAYRRPAATEEVERLMVFARWSLTQEGESFIRPMSTYAPLRASLSSPYFLFRIEKDPPEGIAPINEFELASRLSYFLWSSMPDDELLKLANEKKLRAHQEEQVRRMLKDPKARALTENFAEQWLCLSALKNASPDPNLYPNFDESLRAAMRQETQQFVERVFKEDRSIMEFLDADYTYLNERLAMHYGIEGVKGDQFRLVKLDPKQHRGGLMTQGSILTLTSPPTRTSPVKRGIWVLQTLFNNPPAPPPANVPPLESEGAALTGTVRQVLQQHRANAQCAGCHNKIDPYGLALENYNAIGVWRTKEGEFDIDSSGDLPNGRSFKNVAEFRAVLLANQAEFRKAFVEKLLIYALGRGLEYADKYAVQDICSRASSQQDRFSSVILAIVESDLFQKRKAKGR
jgi:mono/diheme cytochrome c family protein